MKLKISVKDAYWNAYHDQHDLTQNQINQLQQVIIDSEDSGYAYLFALHIKGADVKALEDTVIKGKDIFYIKAFRDNIPDANKERINKLLVLL